MEKYAKDRLNETPFRGFGLTLMGRDGVPGEWQAVKLLNFVNERRRATGLDVQSMDTGSQKGKFRLRMHRSGQPFC